jgi:predicted porin
MKKFTLTALLLLASLGASAQVAIYGKIGQYVDSTKTGNTTVNSVVAEPTSNIGFSAQENLGSGLKARVVVETKILANDPTSANTQLGDRQSTVGIASKYGSVDLGRNTHSLFGAIASNDPFGVYYGTTMTDLHNVRSVYLSNSMFVTVSPLPNVSASYDRSQNGSNGTADATSYGLSGSFGIVSANYARWESGSDTTDVLGGRAVLGATTLYALYSESKTAGVTTKADSIGVGQKIVGTPFTVKASYGTKTGDVKAYNLGTDYAFSKRTTAQLVYRVVNQPSTANDIKQVGVGILHQF